MYLHNLNLVGWNHLWALAHRPQPPGIFFKKITLLDTVLLVGSSYSDQVSSTLVKLGPIHSQAAALLVPQETAKVLNAHCLRETFHPTMAPEIDQIQNTHTFF